MIIKQTSRFSIYQDQTKTATGNVPVKTMIAVKLFDPQTKLIIPSRILSLTFTNNSINDLTIIFEEHEITLHGNETPQTKIVLGYSGTEYAIRDPDAKAMFLHSFQYDRGRVNEVIATLTTNV